MIVFRLICAIMVAWAINWVLARPEAAVLIEDVPEMVTIGPIAGAVVGFVALAKRQGWGLIVSVVNGGWTGLLTVALSGFMYLAFRMWDSLSHNLIKDFEHFMRILNSEAQPLIERLQDYPLILITLGVCAIAGFASEILHWCLVRIRRARGEEEPKKEVRAGVARPGGSLS
jgi:hypothetical protein